MKTSISDYLLSPLVWLQIIIVFLLLTILTVALTPLGPLLGAWAGNTFVKELTVKGVSGSFLSSVTVDKVEWRDGNVTTISDLHFDAGRPDFSQNQLPINQLNIGSLDISLAPNTTPRKRGELVNIGNLGTSPLNLVIKSGQLSQLKILEEGVSLFQLNNLRLDGTEVKDDTLLLKDVSAEVMVSGAQIAVNLPAASMNLLVPHDIELDGSLSWQHEDVGDVTAKLRGEGQLQSYVLTAEGGIAHPAHGQQAFALRGKGDFDHLAISELTSGGDSGSLRTSGEVAWVPNVSVDLGITTSQLNTAQFMPEWPAELTSQLALQVSQANGQLRGALNVDSLSGSLRGYPVSGSGKVSLLEEELLFDQFELKSSKNTLKVDGRGSEPFDLSWDVNGSDLAAMMPGVTGRLTARGTLTGSQDQPQINGKLSTTRLSFQGNKLDGADLDIKTVDGQFQLDGRLTGLLVNGERILSATLSGRGDVDQHSVTVRANHSQAKIDAEVDGAWNGKVWQGTLKTLNINDRQVGQWRLQKPTGVQVSAAGIVSDELCLVGSDGSACSQLDYNQQNGVKTQGKLANAPLDILNPFIPEALRLEGRVSGDYAVSLKPDLKGSADLTFAPGQVTVNQGGTTQRVAYRGGRLIAEVDGSNINATTEFNLVDEGLIKAQAEAQLSPSDGRHTIQASGEFKAIPLALTQSVLPENMNLSGMADGVFRLSQAGDQRSGSLTLASKNTQFVLNDAQAGRQRYQFSRVNIEAALKNNQLESGAKLTLVDGASLDVTASADLSASDLTKAINTKGKVSRMPMSLVQPYLPQAVGLSGLVSGDFDIRQESGQPQGVVDLMASSGEFAYQPEGQKKLRYAYTSAKIQARIQGQKVDGNVDLALKNGGQFSGQAAVDLSQPDLIKSVNAEGKLQAIPLAMVRPYLPPEFDIEGGVISGDYRVNQQGGKPVGQFNLQSSAGVFVYQPAGANRQRIDYQTISLVGALQGDQLQADAKLALRDGGQLTSRVSADITSFDQSPVFTAEGVLQRIPMAMAQPYLPEGLTINGNINAEYQVSQRGKLTGKVRVKLTAGSVSYDEGSRAAQTYRYRSAEIVADIDGDNVAAEVAFALQDGGALTTKGRLDLSKPNNLFAFEGEGSFDAFPLALLQPYLPVPIEFEGVAQGRYQLTQRGGQRGSVDITLPASRLIVTDPKGTAETFDYKEGRLKATINGQSIIADASIRLKSGGVLDGKANIVLGATARANQINVEGNLTAVPLSLVEPYLPEDLAFPGNVNGSYQLSQRNGKLAGRVNLGLPNSYFVVETASGDRQSFAYEQGLLNATMEGNRVMLDSTLVFKGRGDLKARAQLVLRDQGEPSINGVAEVNIPNIYWAQSYVPYSRGLQGQVVGKVSFSGLVSRPRVTGQLAMSNGYLRLPQVGTELTDINLRIQADKANQAVIVGSMKSGGGIINANGRLSLADIKNWKAQMSLSGNNIKFVDTHEAKAFMSPNLQINANPKAVVIRGTIDIPTADINLKDLPELSVSESEDVVVIGETLPSTSIDSVRMQPDVMVRLGNNVRFKGFGFKTRLVGGLRVTNSRNTIVTNGSLNILEGRYEAYGQDLKIDNGRLVFNGPPKNVGLNVRAVREIDSGTVGIHLSGTLQKLKSTIFSDPVMQETDALSYLVTGNSLASATGRETALLMQAVRGLGIDGSDGLIQRIGKSIGLDDLSIVTRTDFRESELQLGKKLGSKLYVRYLVGIFDSAHRVAMEYKINKYLNLEVQAGEEQSLDLIYEYEKD